MNIKKISLAIILFIFVSSLSSCAPKGYVLHSAGFFSGIWHGYIIFFSIIGKIFGINVGIYAEHNTGFFYWLGYFIGLGGLGAIGKLGKKRPKSLK
jgi:hypothetical protein